MNMDTKATADKLLKLVRRITPEQWEIAKPLIEEMTAPDRLIPRRGSNKRNQRVVRDD